MEATLVATPLTWLNMLSNMATPKIDHPEAI